MSEAPAQSLPIPRPDASPKLSPEVVAGFKNYIYLGGMMIKEGKFGEAMEHFRNKVELAKVNISLSHATDIFIKETPKPNDYADFADTIAKNSILNNGENLELSSIRCFIKGDDGTVQEQKITLPNELQHEISLIYMEEWLHCLQLIQGRSLTGEANDEFDVMFYMQKNEIPITQAFLGRYDRAEALGKR